MYLENARVKKLKLCIGELYKTQYPIESYEFLERIYMT